MRCVGCSMESNKVPCPYCGFMSLAAVAGHHPTTLLDSTRTDKQQLTDKQKMELWQAVVVPAEWDGTPAWATALGMCS